MRHSSPQQCGLDALSWVLNQSFACVSYERTQKKKSIQALTGAVLHDKKMAIFANFQTLAQVPRCSRLWNQIRRSKRATVLHATVIKISYVNNLSHLNRLLRDCLIFTQFRASATLGHPVLKQALCGVQLHVWHATWIFVIFTWFAMHLQVFGLGKQPSRQLQLLCPKVSHFWPHSSYIVPRCLYNRYDSRLASTRMQSSARGIAEQQ